MIPLSTAWFMSCLGQFPSKWVAQHRVLQNPGEVEKAARKTWKPSWLIYGEKGGKGASPSLGKAFPELPSLKTCCEDAAMRWATQPMLQPSVLLSHSHQLHLRCSLILPAQPAISNWWASQEHRDPERILHEQKSLCPLSAVGFPLILSHPVLAPAAVMGRETVLLPVAWSCSGWMNSVLLAPIYSGLSGCGKGLQPISVGAGEAALLLGLCCCCPRASLCHFVIGFGGAGGKAMGLPSPCNAPRTPRPLLPNPPPPGGMQGQGGHLGEWMLLGRWGKEGWG